MRRVAFAAPVFAVLVSVAALAAIAPRPAAASAAEDLTAATAAGQAVYIVVTDASVADVKPVAAAAAEAATAVKGKSLVLDRGAAANADLVAKYRLASAPVPLVLVLASNGLPVAGLPGEQDTPMR